MNKIAEHSAIVTYRRGRIVAAWVLAMALALVRPAMAVAGGESVAEAAIAAAKEGKIRYRLTEPEELKQVLGRPTSEESQRDGDGEQLVVNYPDVRARFFRLGGQKATYTLWQMLAKGQEVDIGAGRKVVLRRREDLGKVDRFWGVVNMSLVNLDLRGEGALLRSLPFDSRTEWPGADKLPEGFDPKRILEECKNPGLGVRKLHEQGIDGRGVGIAIVDQPLLRTHQEYTDRLVRYEDWVEPKMEVQMHGVPIASIAVGKSCGVAPGSKLHYFSAPAWVRDNSYCVRALDEVMKWNQAHADDRIRVVSISFGDFSRNRNVEQWKASLKKANESGILVVTCDTNVLRYGAIRRVIDKDIESPEGWERGIYAPWFCVLLVPAGRTTAGHEGNDLYTFWSEGGMSWAAPYLAGLGALAFQVNPQIEPGAITRLLVETASRAKAGPVVNPAGFIEAVKKAR